MDPRNSTNPKEDKNIENRIKVHHYQFTKKSDKEKILKSDRKVDIYYIQGNKDENHR
jgi:hypothetical protein